jgi:ABC-type sugar transport system ATPase subunit
VPALVAGDLHKGRRLRGVSFTVSDGETLVILGPSGAGKTSLLRVIAGLESADGGTLELDGRDLLRIPPQRRRVGVVFQDDALFPHMTIYENLAFALRMKRVRAVDIDARVRTIAQALEISAHLRQRPARLSGGERQRAALARSVLSDPRVLLLDEPLAHLDPQLRAHVRRQFIAFRRTFTGAAVHVTHDHVEAMSVGDQLAIMMEGRIVQCGVPQNVYDSPASVEVARFFGSPPMNLLDGEMEITGIRPEHVRIDPAAALRGSVASYESWGPDVFVQVRTGRGDVVARVEGSSPVPEIGDQVAVKFDDRFVRRFDRTTGVLLK